MSRNTFRTLACAAAACAAVVVTTGAASTPPAADPTSPIATTVRALVDGSGEAAVSAVPEDFASVIGYRPSVEDAMADNPHGDCSSPLPLPSEFDTACKAHDLGYDLLRYAAATGTAVDPQWRRALDGQLESRMHDSCTDRSAVASRHICHAAASVAATAVDINSWRQSFGPPVAEPALPFAVGGVVVAVSLMTVSLAGRHLSRWRPRPMARVDS